MSESLSRLLDALRAAGLSLDTERTRDALWLALQITGRKDPSIPVSDFVRHAKEIQPASEETADGLGGEEMSLEMEEAAEGSSHGLPSRLMRLSVPPSLAGSRALGRSLRPLRRKVPSPAGFTVDIAATVRQAAEEDVWVPVLRARPERWLSLSLVVERSLSMAVFHETLRELRRAFRYSGAFRDLRIWWLDTEDANAKVYARPQDAARGTRARRFGEVPGSGRRTLVLVLSDCVSDAWYDGQVLSALAIWSRNAPVALLQVLPERMWPRTALGEGERMQLHASAELQTNSHLRWTPEIPGPWGQSATCGFLLAAANLDPAALYSLARMFAGKGSGRVQGFLFDVRAQQRDGATSNVTVAQGATERVRRFFALSSACRRPPSFVTAG